MHGYIAQPRSRIDIRALAFGIRSKLGLQHELYFPIVQYLEHALPVLDKKFLFEVGEAHRLGEDHAVTYPKDGLIHVVIRNDVYERACRGEGRDRGTCAHEAGHYHMHARAPMLARSFAQEIKTYRDPEWQAKCFHGELLVPMHLVRGMSPHDVVRRCGVSLDCAVKQLNEYAKVR